MHGAGVEGRRRPPRAEPQNPGPAKRTQMNGEWKMTKSSFLKGENYARDYTVSGGVLIEGCKIVCLDIRHKLFLKERLLYFNV